MLSLFFLLLRGKSPTLFPPLLDTPPYFTLLSSNPPPSCSPSSPVTLAFSPNVNPNRLSTEGYCSSSQKRRQIFRYWGAADLDLCVAMPIFWKWFGDDSGDLWWFLSIFAWRSRLIDGYSSTAPWGLPGPMHGCFVVSLGTDWPTYPFTHSPPTTFIYKVSALLPQQPVCFVVDLVL